MNGKDLSRFNSWTGEPHPHEPLRTVQSVLGVPEAHRVTTSDCGQSSCNCGGGCNGECAPGN